MHLLSLFAATPEAPVPRALLHKRSLQKEKHQHCSYSLLSVPQRKEAREQQKKDQLQPKKIF